MKKITFLFLALAFLLLVKTPSAFAYSNNMNASVVLGQPDFTSHTFSTVTRTSLSYPTGIYTDGSKLYVVDGSDRVLIYNSIPTTSNASPDVVVGAPDFNTDLGCATVTAKTLCTYNGLTTAGNKLIIPDQSENRVLIWNTIPTTNYAAADVVIGQQDMTSHSANQGGSPDANTINSPFDAFYDQSTGKLLVADYSNNRVLIYNHVPTTNNASADVVIGQADFTHRLANRGGSAAANTLSGPYMVSVISGKLLIADAGNNRVLVYNSIPTSNGVSADVVIGQQDMSSTSANQGGSVAANTLNIPVAVAYDGKRLFVNDNNNNRVLVYDGVPTSNNASALQVIGQQNLTSSGSNQGGSANANTIGRSDHGLFAYRDRVFLTDSTNNRALIYNNDPAALGVGLNLQVGSTTATLTYSTSLATSEYVDYGGGTNYGSVLGIFHRTPRVTSHTISFSNLSPCSVYHYLVTATDSNLKDYESGDQSFTTKGTCTTFKNTWTDSNGVTYTFGPAMGNNIESADELPTFTFGQAQDTDNGITEYQIIVNSIQYGDVVYLDGITPTSPNGTDTYEDANRWERYHSDSNTIEVRAKQDTQKMAPGAYRWKVRAINGKGATLDSDTRVIRIKSHSAVFSDNNYVFPLSLLQVGNQTKINISSYSDDSVPKKTLVVSTRKPTFFGIANAGAHISLLLQKHDTHNDLWEYLPEMTTDANGSSRWGINVTSSLSPGEYKVILTATNDSGDYVELPQFSIQVK